MLKTHIIVIPDEKFANMTEDNFAVIVKPEKTIAVNDIVVFENSKGEQHTKYVDAVTDRPGLMKGWVLLETTVKEF